MKTIELAYIFPFTLMIMVLLIFLSFSLHDMILYKASSYKYLVCNGPNSEDYFDDDSQNITLLKKYISNFSLTNNIVSLEKTNNDINVKTAEYKSTISCVHFDKCDLLRKCSVAADLIDNITEE